MKITVLTICPDEFSGFLDKPLISRCIDSKILLIDIIDIREYVDGCFRKVDDSPYGGGPGMILRMQPILDALNDVIETDSHSIILSPVGKRYDQKDAHRLCEESHLIFICGHYEGIDARVYTHVDESLSIGDYILNGGELPAMVIIESVVRLLDGSIKKESITDESFEHGLLEYPQYTRPKEYNGQKVPDILLSGNHEAIKKWQDEQALETTKKYRPDLLKDKE